MRCVPAQPQSLHERVPSVQRWPARTATRARRRGPQAASPGPRYSRQQTNFLDLWPCLFSGVHCIPRNSAPGYNAALAALKDKPAEGNSRAKRAKEDATQREFRVSYLSVACPPATKTASPGWKWVRYDALAGALATSRR